MMERQVEHLVRLVDDLLEVSRISRGALELRKEPVDIASVARNARRDERRRTCRAGEHRLTVSMPGEPLWVEADPVRLAQVLANLLNNAAHYTPRGGRHCARSGTRRRRRGSTGARRRRRHPARATADDVRDVHPRRRRAGARSERPRHRACARRAAWCRCTAARSMRGARVQGAAASSPFACRSSSRQRMQRASPTRRWSSPDAASSSSTTTSMPRKPLPWC